jgi:hypothetical protein
MKSKYEAGYQLDFCEIIAEQSKSDGTGVVVVPVLETPRYTRQVCFYQEVLPSLFCLTPTRLHGYTSFLAPDLNMCQERLTHV